MMKGYLTVFLALSLSILTGFILFLTFNAIKNGEKVRFECAADIGMNAVLSEYHTELFDKYGLLYVDASYLGNNPSEENVEERLRFYIERNTNHIFETKNAPWGSIQTKDVDIISFETAAAGKGLSMRNQAVNYIEDAGIVREETQILSCKSQLLELEALDPLGEWSNIMGQLAEIELPLVINEQNEWEEVPLSNPADWVYGLTGSDALYLAEARLDMLSPISIDTGNLISHRPVQNTSVSDRIYKQNEKMFLTYLFEKMGNYEDIPDDSILCCQIEYLVEGKESDLENMAAVAERIFRWRFADNAEKALADGNLRSQAQLAANELLAVQLKREFEDPVVQSILYACAFLESIGDLKALYAGGKVPLRKGTHQMSVDKVLGGVRYTWEGSNGFGYSQYLAGMLVLMDAEMLNLRTMDIMEMDIRFRKGNAGFCMDWCIERLEAVITAGGGLPDVMRLRRKYGYF